MKEQVIELNLLPKEVDNEEDIVITFMGSVAKF